MQKKAMESSRGFQEQTKWTVNYNQQVDLIWSSLTSVVQIFSKPNR